MSIAFRLFLVTACAFVALWVYHVRRAEIERWLGLRVEDEPLGARWDNAWGSPLGAVPELEDELSLKVVSPRLPRPPPSAGRRHEGLGFSLFAGESRWLDPGAQAGAGQETEEDGEAPPDEAVTPAAESEFTAAEDRPPPLPSDEPALDGGPDVSEPPSESGGLRSGEPAGGGAGLRRYRVQAGDNLWKIAERHLGDGMRCREIERLNAAVLRGSSYLQVGIELELPQAAADRPPEVER
jgi:hypothetical protein